MIALRDGRRIRIRPTRLDDAADLHAMQRRLLEDGRGQVMALSDHGPLDRFEGRMMGRLADAIWRVAELEGRVVGEASVSFLGPALLSHVGLFGISVDPSAQGVGLGRALARAVLEEGFAHGVLRMELYVRSDNHRAIALYESLGFHRESTRERFVRLPDGGFLDDHIMVRFAD